ncbi:hypothetical protein JL720_5408 [Aureococcus anophagefferens]|nr:hypothetical protein JL720_5408 [Aureococcus anophagefferens]
MYKLLALFGTASAAAAAAPAPSPLAIVIDPAMEVFTKGVDALTEVSGWVLAVPQSLADAAVWWIDLNLGMPALIRDVLTGDSVRARVSSFPRHHGPRPTPSPGPAPRGPRSERSRVLFFNSGAVSNATRARDPSPSRPLVGDPRQARRPQRQHQRHRLRRLRRALRDQPLSSTAESIRDYHKGFLTLPKADSVLGVKIPKEIADMLNAVRGPAQSMPRPVKKWKHKTIVPLEGGDGSSLGGTIATVTSATAACLLLSAAPAVLDSRGGANKGSAEAPPDAAPLGLKYVAARA